MSKVSVVLPVYKAERFLSKAIESVLMQPEVDELILVEDGSGDGSLSYCQDIVSNNKGRVVLLTHRNNANKGAAASRNLGILHAKNDLVAFLDADDYYLTDRFKNAIDFLNSNPDSDGIYEAIGTHFYDEEGRNLHLKRMKELSIEGLPLDLTTLTDSVEPRKLFEALIMGNKGWFHFNGLTLRKSAFLKAGLLDNFLWYGQDIEFFLRLSIYADLHSGNLKEPVAMRGVYAQNSTLSVYTNAERLFMNQRCSAYRWKKLYLIMLESNFPLKVNRFLLNRYVDNFDDQMSNLPINLKRKIRKLYVLSIVMIRHKKTYQKVVG